MEHISVVNCTMIKLPDFNEERQLWQKGYDLVIGVDEVGRGCFAGPVVASAVAFSSRHLDRVPMQSGRVERSHSSESVERDFSTTLRFARNDTRVKIDDSKRLKPFERKNSAAWIKNNCLAYGIGEINVPTIHKVWIGKATTMAMRRAVSSIMNKVSSIRGLSNKNALNTKYLIPNTFVLVDAFHIKFLRGVGLINQKAITKGDQKSISIAAASIVAKVYRDRLMAQLSKQYTLYGWGRNKGYGTREHQEAIVRNGITKLHRIMFVETFLASRGLTMQA